MPGVKGSGGPPPKRSDQRRRVNAPAAGEPTKAAGAKKVPVPRGDKDWHPVAKRWYGSLARSGQARFYEPSDWATAYVLAESMSRELSPQPVRVGQGDDAVVEMVAVPPKGASMAAWLKGMTALMVTEGDRRRAAVELSRPQVEEESPDVSVLDEYRRRSTPG